MPEGKSYHMSPVEFRRLGHAVIDWIADYYERVESLIQSRQHAAPTKKEIYFPEGR